MTDSKNFKNRFRSANFFSLSVYSRIKIEVSHLPSLFHGSNEETNRANYARHLCKENENFKRTLYYSSGERGTRSFLRRSSGVLKWWRWSGWWYDDDNFFFDFHWFISKRYPWIKEAQSLSRHFWYSNDSNTLRTRWPV